MPGGVASQVQMHMLSVDVSAAARASRGWAANTTARFPVYARARTALSGRSGAPPRPRMSGDLQGMKTSRPMGTGCQGMCAVGEERDWDCAEDRTRLMAEDERKATRELRAKRQGAARRAKIDSDHSPSVQLRRLGGKNGGIGRLAIGATPSPSTSEANTMLNSARTSSSSEYGEVIGGHLSKRGRRTRLLRLRFLTIDRSMLRSYRTETCPLPSWALDLRGALVGLDPHTHRIVLMLDRRRRLVLFARSARDAQLWADAFVEAADPVAAFARHPSTVAQTRPREQAREPAGSREPSPTQYSVQMSEDYTLKTDTELPDRIVLPSSGSTTWPTYHSPPPTEGNPLDPTDDMWDTFRSFSALNILNHSREMKPGSSTTASAASAPASDPVIAPHEIYTVLAD
jgi:hypothetical protein